MSQHYRKVLRARLIRELVQELQPLMFNIANLIADEHPNWGDPGAELAHHCAQKVVRDYYRQERQRQLLATSKPYYLRRGVVIRGSTTTTSTTTTTIPPLHPRKVPKGRYGRSMALPSTSSRPRTLQPSARELAKQQRAIVHSSRAINPADVPLPSEDDENPADYLPPEPSPAIDGSIRFSSSPSCRVLTTRLLAGLMRRLDRCAITASGIHQLSRYWNELETRIDRIDAGQRAAAAQLGARTQARYSRIWHPERYQDVPPGIAQGRSSQLSLFTLAEDAEDPWGQRCAWVEMMALETLRTEPNSAVWEEAWVDDRNVNW